MFALAVAVWLGAVWMSGVVAATVFPEMRDLNPRLPGYAAYEGEHWRLAAGRVAARVFLAGDAIALVSAMIATVALLVSVLYYKACVRRGAGLVRVAGFVAAMALLGFQFSYLGPRMHPELARYWEAAAAGDNEAARAHLAAFDRHHPTASNVLIGMGLSLALTLVAGVWQATSASQPAASGGHDGPGRARSTS